MRVIKSGFEILSKIDGMEILKSLEIARRTCYKSYGQSRLCSMISLSNRHFKLQEGVMLEVKQADNSNRQSVDDIQIMHEVEFEKDTVNQGHKNEYLDW